LKQIDLTGVGAVTFAAVAPAQYQAKGGKIEVHLDSPTGALLGESELIRPTADAAPLRLRTVLGPTSGVHDVYLVFRNSDAKSDQFLFGLLTATFEAAATSPR
jgi:cytochrome c